MIWIQFYAKLPGWSQLSNPSDLPFFMNFYLQIIFITPGINVLYLRIYWNKLSHWQLIDMRSVGDHYTDSLWHIKGSLFNGLLVTVPGSLSFVGYCLEEVQANIMPQWPRHDPLYPWHQRQKSWWHHQMETFSALLALCAGNSPTTGEFGTVNISGPRAALQRRRQKCRSLTGRVGYRFLSPVHH